MNLSKIISSIGNTYNKSTLWCKLLIFMSLFLLLLVIAGKKNKKEGFEQHDAFLLKDKPADIYDDFYASVYDYLVFNTVKDDYEVGFILNSSSPTSDSKILDIGCGTGHHVASLGAKGLDVLGIDISPSMIKKAQENYPDYKFIVKDATNNASFNPNSFTHILCMYFTIYYFPDKTAFFHNCYQWLSPNGYLFVHIVDRDKFDPILPPGNPLMYVSPQRYAKERITSTKVKFNDFSYSADFKFNNNADKALFVEKFKDDNTGKVRKNEHTLYMEDAQQIIDQAQSCGFILETKADLIQCQYEYQYVYVFMKPS